MSTKESELTVVLNTDFSSNDVVRVLVSDSSRNISLSEFSKSLQSELEGLGFVTTSAAPSEFTQTRNITAKSADFLLDTTMGVVFCTTTSGVITVTLPVASAIYNTSNATSQQFTVKRITSDSNSVIISPPGGALIDGSATYTLAGPALTTVTFLTDGNNWYTVG